MLDENLPTFVIGGPTDRSKLDSTIHYTQHGSELTPAYTLRKPDPASPTSKNRYAVALYDAYYPEILFAEILLIPEWTQPSLSAEQVRQNGGVPPPPEPVLPSEFTIQLYNPDQQIVVRQKRSGTFSSTPTWEFDMPQQTFRQPSNSAIDRIQSDPAALDLTPKLGFKWKKDSKLSKDLACFSSGRTVNADGSKKRNKEPDITVAIFRALKEITLYEPNFQRIDIEDLKGFEVVLLLGAVAVRDIYFGHMRETFNISESPLARTTSPSSRPAAHPTTNPSTSSHANGTGTTTAVHATSRPVTTSPRPPRVPPTDPRSQWEIDTETQRLKAAHEAELAERKRREAAEQKEIKRMLEAEEREKRRQQAEIDKETERLKKLYGKEQAQAEASLRPTPVPTPQRYSAPHLPTTGYQDPHARPSSTPHHAPRPPHQHAQSFAPQPGSYQPYAGGPYLLNQGASQSTYFGGPSTPGQGQPGKLKEKKSNFFGFGSRPRGLSEEDLGAGGGARLTKKKSSIF